MKEPDIVSEDVIDFAPNNHQYYIRDVVIAICCICFFLWDWTTDILTAFNYYYNGDLVWFQITLTVVIGPSLIMMIISFYWYLTDQDKNSISKMHWCLRISMLILQLGPIARYLEGIHYGLRSRQAWKSGNRKLQILNYRLMLKEDSDAAVTNLAYCFLETAPQLIIQLFILLDITNDHERTNYQGFWLYMLWMSCISSLLSLSWSVTATARTNRFIDETKLNVSVIGTLLLMLWQLFVISARIMVIVLFAKMYSYWVFVFGVGHWLVMFIWIIWRRPLRPAFPHCLSCETAFSMILAGIYNFAYVNDKEELTRTKYFFFHSICFCENFVVVILWYCSDAASHWYYIPGFILPCLLHILGIIVMCMYYGFFHPSKLPLKASCGISDKSEVDGRINLVSV